jgi:hypothetical protein
LLFDQYAPFAILKPKNRKTGCIESRSSSPPQREREGFSGERERERASDMGVCFFLLTIFMEFTTQGSPFQVHLISALIHTGPKRIEKNEIQKGSLLGPSFVGGPVLWRRLIAHLIFSV